MRKHSLASRPGGTLPPQDYLAARLSPLASARRLTRSQSGIVDKDAIDERRAAYESEDGEFDADAFAADLSTAQRNNFLAQAIWPGLPNLVMLIAYLKADGISASMAAWGDFTSAVEANLALWGSMMT